MTNASRVTVWNEYQQEKTNPKVTKLYPNGIHVRKIRSFLFGALNCASQGAIILLVITLSATAASTSSMRSPITEDSTLSHGAIVKPTLLVSQHLPLHLAQNDVRRFETRTQRIVFKPGAVGTVVEGSLGRSSRIIYLLRARRGQRMTLSLTSLKQNAVFDVQAPDGQYLQEEATSFRGELPLTGDYSVIISGTRGNTNYTLEVTIR